MNAPSLAPLRLVVYDRTCTGSGPWPGLTHSWIAGGLLYRLRNQIDLVFGAADWTEALTWLASVQPERRIAEIQYWGHGKWGQLHIDRQALDERALLANHPHAALLTRIQKRLVGPQAMLWLRTCETFGAERGHIFATSLADRMGCKVAGHTYIIGPFQSGLHSLAPGQQPAWSTDEGIREGTAQTPQRALWSTPWAPHTIHCLQGKIPSAY